MKLEKLTPEQERLCIEVRDEWIGRLKAGAVVDREVATREIKYWYAKAGLKEPEVKFFESPPGAQMAVAVRDSVWASVRDSVRDSVWDSVRASVWASVWASVRDSVRASVWASVWDSVWTPVGYISWHGNISDYGWVAFYDAFRRLGVFKNKEFDRFCDLLKSNIYDMIQLDSLCIVCSMPSVLERDGRGRLHSTTQPAIEWADGYHQHHIHGVFFDEALWRKVTSSTVTAQEVIALQSIEQRRVALEMFGHERLIKEFEGEVVNISERGNELFRITKHMPMPVYLLRYCCPSTGRVYVSPVKDKVVREWKDRQADRAMARKFSMTLSEYDNLRVEA